MPPTQCTPNTSSESSYPNMFLTVEQKNKQTTPTIEAEHDRTHRAGEAGRGRDRDKTGNATRKRAEERRLTLHDPFGEHPGQRSRRRGDEGVDHGQSGDAGGFEVRIRR